MKKLVQGLADHVAGEATTLCNCWLILRDDGQMLGFTDHDKQLEFGGNIYAPSSGFEASQMEETVGLTPDNHEIMGALLSDAITEADIHARRYDGARIRHYVVNWMAPEEHVHMQTYLFGEIKREDGIFRAELNSLVTTLDQTNIRRFEKRCSADLGDAKCGVDLEGAFSVSATIVKILATDTIVVDGLAAFESGWFAQGRMTVSSGPAPSKPMQIASHFRDTKLQDHVVLTLWSEPTEALSVGDQLILYPGCDKLAATCRTKFNNILNFRGFPHMPGSEFAASYASNSKNMDGGPLIP